MTAFVKRLLHGSPNGRAIRTFKEQLAALSAAIIRLAVADGERAFQIERVFPVEFGADVFWRIEFYGGIGHVFGFPETK